MSTGYHINIQYIRLNISSKILAFIIHKLICALADETERHQDRTSDTPFGVLYISDRIHVFLRPADHYRGLSNITLDHIVN